MGSGRQKEEEKGEIYTIVGGKEELCDGERYVEGGKEWREVQ